MQSHVLKKLGRVPKREDFDMLWDHGTFENPFGC